MSSFPPGPGLLLLAGDVSCGSAAAGREAAGAGHGRGPQPAVLRIAAVLRRRWPPSPCWGATPYGLRPFAGGGWLVLLRGCDACRAVGGGLQSEAALIDVLLDVGSLPPRSSSPTVAGCRLGGFSVGRDWWGGELIVGGVVPCINIGTWGLCDSLCLVLVCRFFSSFWDRVWAE